jgi:glyoxylate/hydroxypyruvate/2-ketogluconate reductase
MPLKPNLLITRAIFPETVEKLSAHFNIDWNKDDTVLNIDQLIARLDNKDAALTFGTEPINSLVLKQSPKLKIVANMTVGFNNFDVSAMRAANVVGTNAPDVLTETTADMGFALLMATARRISESEAYLREGKWAKWSYDMFMGSDVHGSTLGILGMGRIGQAIARRGSNGFGMKVLYHNRTKLSPEIEEECKAKYVEKDALYLHADHLLIVLPYSIESHHIINAAVLKKMKPTATLINIGRGGLVDENALVDSLIAKKIAAAGLDVFEGEPVINPRLLALKNVVLTPHISSASLNTRRAMADLAANNLINFFLRDAPLPK